jgi:hypothetical protein
MQGFPQYKNVTEATVDAVRTILRLCERSGTVRRVIHTASVTAASPLREDGSGGYKDSINESCWTPLNLSYGFSNAHLDVRKLSLDCCRRTVEVSSIGISSPIDRNGVRPAGHINSSN